jgi:predicted Zn-dependent protease
MAAAPHAAVVKEYERDFTTYPYSDPDPVPTMSKFYPYFRYDGFTDSPVQKKWKVVELSNDYLQLLILPEIGGKVWAAIEKSTGKSFIYFNHVIKFRDVAMRGPWTSGGMEPNYGIMGHTPNCFSPVDYLVRQNTDGSASCIIGVLDLLTRTTWRLEINLPADQACFATRSFWHNGSAIDEPYYTWMNIGIKSAGNLQFINPGTKYLGHDGKVFDWPKNPENGHDISWYNQNNFGSYKSYHIIGRPAEFFGGYWHDEDFGIARCSTYVDKPGRKIWIWGLSREGMIWEKLLTDSDGQYVEVQSGRLFNQADEASTLTPFKHKEFAAYATDTWTEYWLPVKGTKGFVSASPWGALNVAREGERLSIMISPARPLHDKLRVFDGPQMIAERNLNLSPMQPIEETVKLKGQVKALRVTVGGDKLSFVFQPDDDLSRPVETPNNFDWKSTYGLYLKGKENARQRFYSKAEEGFRACLKTDANFAPALVEMASLENRRGHYTEASDFARRALSIDTYDPGANYQFGLASAALDRRADTQDAFSLAALSTGCRSAACVELAKEFLREKRYERGLEASRESLEADPRNIDALQLQVCINRLLGKTNEAEAALSSLFFLDPLNHFARFERYLRGKAHRQEFTSLIRNELPQETYLELAAWYHAVSLDEEAIKVLELAPPSAEVLYWLAYLHQDKALLQRADAASPAFVFPFRSESAEIFKWAADQSAGWQPKYYLALLSWSQGDLSRAQALLAACGDESRFAPLYAARAQVSEETAARDLEKAGRLDPNQWRYGAMLVRYHLKQNDPAAALAVAADYTHRFPTNGALALLHAKALLASAQYQSAAKLLSSLNLLPCEGNTEAHSLFRESYLWLALERSKAHEYDQALRLIDTARQWPETLGAGKPYPDDEDERLEDWLNYQCHLQSNSSADAQHDLERIISSSSPSRRNVGQIIRALALKQSGRASEAEKLINDWLKDDPTNDLAKWGMALLSERTAPLPATIQDGPCRILAAAL